MQSDVSLFATQMVVIAKDCKDKLDDVRKLVNK